MHFASTIHYPPCLVGNSRIPIIFHGTARIPFGAPSSPAHFGLSACTCIANRPKRNAMDTWGPSRDQRVTWQTSWHRRCTACWCDYSHISPTGLCWLPVRYRHRVRMMERLDEENARIPSDLKPNRSGGLAGLYLVDACGAILQNAILARQLALH